MRVPAAPKAVQIFLHVLRARGWIAGAFVVLAAAGIYGALQVPNDPSTERLIVASDPVALATRDFDRIFPEGVQALIMLETPDPLGLTALRAADRLEQELARIPQVEAHSLLDLYRRAVSTGEITRVEAGRVRAFATGTPLFRRAGLLGDHYFGIALELRVKSRAERDRALKAIDSLVLPVEAPGGTITRVRRVGSPWLNAWLERQSGAATARFMPLFGIFPMTLVLIIYRSWRALGAIILTLGAVIAIAMGLAYLFGWTHTVVSTLVPLTVMVTTTATLVYVHSRYIEPDDSPTLLEHHARALANKFLPCTASMFATAVGFGALAISDIRPVRDMGLWTAGGLTVSWIGCFTLFPALQSLLRTPMRSEKASVAKRFPSFADALVPASDRYRWPLVGGALVLMLCGAAVLFGIPRVIAPLALETDALTYVNPGERVAQDTRYFEESNALDTVELWLQTPPGHALDPEFLRALEQLTRQLESDPRITAVDGPTSVLRWRAMLKPDRINCRHRPPRGRSSLRISNRSCWLSPERAPIPMWQNSPMCGSLSADARGFSARSVPCARSWSEIGPRPGLQSLHCARCAAEWWARESSPRKSRSVFFPLSPRASYLRAASFFSGSCWCFAVPRPR